MDRVINVTVNGAFVRKDSKNAGVQGEANVTTLCIAFSKDWREFSKRIVWWDALGENPVAVLLYTPLAETLENTEEGETAEADPLNFSTKIPGEALAEPGWCSFTIEGYRESDPTEIALTVTDHLQVAASDGYFTPAEPTAPQALQLQRQIDGIMSDVTTLVGDAVKQLDNTEEAVSVWETWDFDTLYYPLNKVERNGSSYICIQMHKEVDPELDVANDPEYKRGNFWQLIAKKGDRGPQGIQGLRGPGGPRGMAGFTVATNGFVAFNVDEDGHLWCSYTGEEQPNYSINEDGHLILTIDT